MDMRELKTLLKFQNFELKDDPPKIRRLRNSRSLPSWSIFKRQTSDSTESESMGRRPVVDLGGGDTLRVFKKVVDIPSSESLPSDFSESTTSHLSSSVMSIADDYSRKASLKSFSEGKQQYDKPTYASCFIKRDNKFRTIMNILRGGRPTASEPQVARSLGKQEDAERREERRLNDIKDATPENNTVALTQTSGKFRSKSLGNVYPTDSYTTDDDVNYEEETTDESEEEEIDDVVERDDETDPYEKAKELVKKITGKIPDSEDEYESDEDEEDNEEFTVFHYRPTRFEYKASPRRRPPRETYVTNKHLTIEKTKEAKFAEVAAMRANESLRRARSLFREISPLRRMTGDTTLPG